MQDDIGIHISGDIESPNIQKQSTSKNGFDFSQILPQLQFAQIGHPHAQQWIQTRRATLRSWSLFFNLNNFRAPPSVPRIGKRIVKNVEYFQIGTSLFICYQLSQKHARQELTLFNHKLTLAQAYMMVYICSLPFFYLVGAGAVLFWVLGVSSFFIAIHSTFYNIDSILCPGEDELNALIVQEV